MTNAIPLATAEPSLTRHRPLSKPQYKAVAQLTGRPTPDMRWFVCTDRTRLRVRRYVHYQWWAGQPGLFDLDATWKVYPGDEGLVLAGRDPGWGKNPNRLDFRAKFRGIRRGHFALFVGRNMRMREGHRYHFLNLKLPAGLDPATFDQIPPQSWVEGHARREGRSWVLAGWEVVAAGGGVG